ncbi:Dual oxidase 2 [Talaromyces islandicus]|uniref:Dual oxidase 2 n=1 Tax=Talaromyces islandicus TaxID=28573 RepID=A0A0U1M2Y2_TALIS|nr:Dual oxidase 2 [Talaromyces islandicus]
MPVQGTEGAFTTLKYNRLLASLPLSWLPYLELVRFSEPLGIPIVLSFFFTGLFYGACLTRPVIQPRELLEPTVYLSLYALVMRYALIAFSDTVDADHDKKVPRTSFRPVARGAITKTQAFSFSGVLFGLGLFILSYLPKRSYGWAFNNTVAMMVFPFMKHQVVQPLFMLGFGYTSAIFQGMATVGVCFSPFSGNFLSTVCLGMATFLLIVIVYTVYAFQDVREDAKAGIISLPILLDGGAKKFLWALTNVMAFLLFVVGRFNDFSPFYYLVPWASCLVLFSAMLLLVDLRIPADCYWWFIRAYLGAPGCLVWGFFVEYCFRVWLLSNARTRNIYDDSGSSEDYGYYNSEDEPAPRNNRNRRGYYGTDESLSSSTDDEERDDEKRDKDDGIYGSKRYYSHGRGRRRSRRRKASAHPDANSVYPFSLPGHRQRRQLLAEDGSTKGSDDTDSEKTEGGSEPSGIWHRTVKDVQHVYSARYTGEKVQYGGLQSAELKTRQYDGKSSQTPLFQWIHFQDSDMNFEVFQDRVDQVQNLTATQRQAVSKLLRKVKNKYDSSLQVATHPTIRVMQPGFLTGVEWPADEQTSMQRTNRAMATNVAWICFPYFSLDQYQGLFSNPKKGAHPMHTLLQTRSSMTSMKREIKQAVCQVGDNTDKLCFHVGQLWCVVIDDSFLVTCGRMPFTTLKGEAVSLNSAPIPGPDLSDSPRILVAYGESVLWIFKAEECPTWFSFYSRFWQFSTRPVEILYQNRVLNEAAWPRILEYAARNERRKQGPLRLSFRLASRKNKDRLDFLSLSNDRLEQPVNYEPVESLQIDVARSPTFTVFTQLNRQKTTSTTHLSSDSIDKKQLSQDLKRMHDYLENEIEPHERIAYRECPESSRQEVFSELRTQIQREQSSATAGNEARTETEKSLVESKKDLVSACDYIFGVFFPFNLTGPSISKFWGGILQVISAEIPYSNEHFSGRYRVRRGRHNEPETREWELELESLVNCFRSIARKLKPFRDVVSMASPADQAKIQIPETLPKAWIHVVMALVLYMVPRPAYYYWESKADIAADLLSDGVAAMLKCLQAMDSLLEDTVFAPFDLATLLVYQLGKDVTNSRPDIEQTYSQHLALLDNEVKSKPLDRSHQIRIQLFREELNAIVTTMQKQEDVVSSIKACYEKTTHHQPTYTKGYEDMKELELIQNNPYPAARAPTDSALFDDFFKQLRPSSDLPGGYRKFLAGDCLSVIGSRRRNAQEMRIEGGSLSRWNLDEIETNRNRQDSAIYVFTVVTVIFLPLSTVAGILGMNTNDVRNMEVDQWVFWAVAVPLTLVVALVCLVATGELRNFMATLVGLWVDRVTLFGSDRWLVVREGDYDGLGGGEANRRVRRRRFSAY